VCVDWLVFAQEGHPSLEAVFAEVDVFLANPGQTAGGRDTAMTRSDRGKDIGL